MPSLKIAAAAACAWLTVATAGHACEVVHVYEYQMKDAGYRMELNGVHLAYTPEPGDYFGGGPMYQWLKEGENTLTVTLETGSADISVKRACRGEFDGETLVEASLAAPESRDLSFFVEGALPPVYDTAEPAKAKGLRDAVKWLKKITNERNFKAYWKVHEGLRLDAERQGFPVEQMRGFLEKIVVEGELEMRDDLVFEPVLDGRVWQVMTSDRKAPISITLREEGGSNSVHTGALWGKIDGKWRIVGN